MKRTCWLIVLALLHVGRLDASGQSRKIIIDCDPGIDDAMALVLALQHPGFEILGITTVFGNARLDDATRNALTVVELSGRSIPVYRGASKPLRLPLAPPPDFVHGKDGLGDTHQPAPRTSARTTGAARFIVDTARAHRGEVTILAVGRLTNLAEALTLDPTLPQHVREVVLMGGAFNVHDPSAVLYLIDPGLFTVRQGPVRVVREGIAIGETIMPAYAYQNDLEPWRGRPLVTTATDVDVHRFLAAFESIVSANH